MFVSSRARKRSKTTQGASPKKAFVRQMVRAGIPSSRSKRLAARFWLLARPEASGQLIERESGSKTVFKVRRPHGGPGVFVVKRKGGFDIRAEDDAQVSDGVGIRKKRVTAHK